MQKEVKHITLEQRNIILDRIYRGFWYDMSEVKPNRGILTILLIMSETGLRLRKVLALEYHAQMTYFDREREKYYLFVDGREITSSQVCNQQIEWYLSKGSYIEGSSIFHVSEQYVARYLQKACYGLGSEYYGITPSSFWMYARDKNL